MLAVIPAAGRASRFGGVFKELLPVGEGTSLLVNALRQARSLGATDYAVVTRASKRELHADHLSRHADLDPFFLVQLGAGDMWGAIQTTLPLRRDSLLVMPDTVFRTRDSVPRNCDFSLGLFETEQPERFGVLSDGMLFNKSTALTGRQLAWGTVYWSANVAEFWRQWEALRGSFASFTAAFQWAMDAFGFETFALDAYYDLGTWESYREFIRGQ